MLASSSFIYEQTKFDLYDRSMIRERKFARVNHNIAKDEKPQIFNKKSVFEFRQIIPRVH